MGVYFRKRSEIVICRFVLRLKIIAGKCGEEWMMGKKIQKPEITKNQIPLIALFVMLSLVLIIVIVIGLRRNQASRDIETSSVPAGEAVQEKWQEGTISHNGKYYKYNNNLRTYLLMGIDKDGPAVEVEKGFKGGQSDAMFLIVSDSENQKISVISINRNTMTKIKTLDESGNDAGEITSQICVQHSYGDGRHYSCSRTVDAVSYLFYNLPISGYLSIYLEAVPILNDAVGGVEVKVLQEINDPNRGVYLPEGDVRVLSGTEAYSYLRLRDINIFGSATDRLHRQEQYIAGYMEKLKTALSGDASKAADIYNSVSEYLVTNVDFVEMVSELMSYEYDGDRMYTVPGETTAGEQYEEYYVDEKALYDLIIQIFYKEVEQH